MEINRDRLNKPDKSANESKSSAIWYFRYRKMYCAIKAVETMNTTLTNINATICTVVSFIVDCGIDVINIAPWAIGTTPLPFAETKRELI